jgi:hypothetical protein
MIQILRMCVLGLLALPLAAQSSGFSLTGGAVLGTESLKKATNNNTGLVLGADWGTKVWDTEVGARVGLLGASLPGTEKNGLKTSLTLLQAHGDLAIPTALSRLSGLVGLSLNSYSMTKAGVESSDPADIDHHFPVRDAKGLKLGLRLGLNLAFSKQFSGELMFQQTELAGKDLTDPMLRQGPINPSWFELDLRWHF